MTFQLCLLVGHIISCAACDQESFTTLPIYKFALFSSNQTTAPLSWALLRPHNSHHSHFFVNIIYAKVLMLKRLVKTYVPLRTSFVTIQFDNVQMPVQVYFLNWYDTATPKHLPQSFVVVVVDVYNIVIGNSLNTKDEDIVPLIFFFLDTVVQVSCYRYCFKSRVRSFATLSKHQIRKRDWYCE